MAGASFSADIAEWARNVEGAVEAIFQQSAQDVVEDMQRVGYSVANTKKDIARGLGAQGRGKKRKLIQGPVTASGEGGNLPVDTGFLRASLMASTSAMPKIKKDKRPEDGKRYDFAPEQIEAIIAGVDVLAGGTVHLGYTAAYAASIHWGTNGQRPRMWVSLAAQNWNKFVEARAAEAKAQFGL